MFDMMDKNNHNFNLKKSLLFLEKFNFVYFPNLKLFVLKKTHFSEIILSTQNEHIN